MAKEYARAFYASAVWHRTKNSYLKSVHRLCERCLKQGKHEPAKIVHHKVHINRHNICDPSITLSFDNLEALCQDCHNKEHSCTDKSHDRYSFDQFGNVKPPIQFS